MPGPAPILIINGPNLNMLGMREPSLYGSETLGDIEDACHIKAEGLGISVDFRHSNHEGELVDWIQEARSDHMGIIINAGAYTHTSIAVHDALRLVDVPIVEVHLTNIYQREVFRHHSYISPLAVGVICGFGLYTYLLALDALTNLLDSR